MGNGTESLAKSSKTEDLLSENQRLREEIQRYRTIADFTYDMERWLLPDQTLAYISPSCERITGYTQDEHYKNPRLLLDIIHPDERKKFEGQLNASYESDLSEPDPARIITKNGEIKWIGIAVNSVRDKEGNHVGYRTSTRDVTQLKEIELQLKQDRSLYSQIVHDHADHIYRMKPDGIITFVNKATSRFFGVTEEEFIGLNFRQFLDESETEDGERVLKNLSVDNPVIRITYNKNNLEGIEVVFDMVIQGYFDGDVLTEVQVMARDITARMRFQQDLRISEERYRAIVESQFDMLIRHKVDGSIVFVNRAFCDYTGIQKEHILGERWFDLVEGVAAKKIKGQIGCLNRQNPSESIEFEVAGLDGVKRWFLFTSTAIFNDKDEIDELQVVGRDIHNEKREQILNKEVLKQAQERKSELEIENIYLKDLHQYTGDLPGLDYKSGKMAEAVEKVKLFSGEDSPVLIHGESGTGKELLAKAIHYLSRRASKVMVSINCASFSSTLIDSELFGRRRGTYTGSLLSQRGRLAMADGSTIFLNEIGTMPLHVQHKLLRVINKGEYQELGSQVFRRVDVRVIAASSKDLVKEVEAGRFSADLYYCLNSLPLFIPPLRERPEDIPLISWSIIDEFTERTGKRIERIAPESIEMMINCPWPGNIRQLKNRIEYSILSCDGPELRLTIPESIPEFQESDLLSDIERTHIVNILDQSNWKIRGKGGAAVRLGLKESTLRYRMKKLNIVRQREGGSGKGGAG